MSALYLVFNAGSSSVKCSLFEFAEYGIFNEIFHSKIEKEDQTDPRTLDHKSAVHSLLDAVSRLGNHQLNGCGHRVVHGGNKYSQPVLLDDKIISELEGLTPYAPLHQPQSLTTIRAAMAALKHVPQVACFDTAFHRSQPRLAQLFALPHAMIDEGIIRYGFHGLSYEYIASVLPNIDPSMAAGRVVVAHLGHGASLCAIKDGRSIATTMGFSVLDGLPMSTRCGALDPGVIFHLIRKNGMSVSEVENLLYRQSGLLGVSGLSDDVRVLHKHSSNNLRAAEALDLFAYRIVREIGALIALLEGIDALIFTAGIGEHDPILRASVLRRLSWLGFKIDEQANNSGGPLLTQPGSARAWVIPTNEALMIARQIHKTIQQH
jgi:acetate kinase